MDDSETALGQEALLRQISDPTPIEEVLPDALPEAASAPSESAGPLGSGRPNPQPSWWEQHRHELAGLVTALVALVWISLGLAARAWGPSLLGVTFALGALLIGTQAVWTAE